MPVGPYTTVRRPIGYVTATGRTFFTFQKRDFTFFLKWRAKNRKKSLAQLGAQSLAMSSHTSLSDHCNSFQLFICQFSVFEDL